MLKIQLLRKHCEPVQGVGPGKDSTLGARACGLMGFRVEGHAGFAQHGQDIVCAGASALVQAALLGLQDALDAEVSFHKEPGYLEVKAEPESAFGIAPRAIFRTLELGLLAIVESYPGYVVVTYEDVD